MCRIYFFTEFVMPVGNAKEGTLFCRKTHHKIIIIVMIIIIDKCEILCYYYINKEENK